jgi:putative tryptophan/tyrosine transport system substrate-binding protein
MVNPRNLLLIALTACAFVVPLTSFGQPSTKVFRVGWLQAGPLGSDQEFVDDIRTALRNLGYVEGKNIVFVFRSADGKSERLQRAAAELVALNPDVIISGATPGTRAAKEATSTIPIVMIGVSDPVGAGFVATLSRPLGNVTGVANLGLDTAGKVLDVLHSVVPMATRIAVLAPDNPAVPRLIDKMSDAAKGLGVTLLPTTVSSLAEIESAFASMVKERAQALAVIADRITFIHRKRISELAAEARLPAIYQYAEQVEAGGLMSYGPNPRNLHQVVAGYIDRILKGAKPADLPVQQPTEFELALNMKTAETLGVKFPPEVLLRADKVIK